MAHNVFRYGGADFAELIIERAQGAYVYGADGKAVLDFTSGQMSGILGHSHPDVYRSPFARNGKYDWQDELDFGFAMLDRQSVGRYAAMIAEPILSSAGIVELPRGYLKALKRKCEERGMLQGVELVTDRQSKTPAKELGHAVSQRCLRLGASLNISRRSVANIFRIAPPLTVKREQIDTAISILDQALAECTQRVATTA